MAEAPAERFDLIARLSAEAVPEIEESNVVRLSRSMADPLAIRQLLLDLPTSKQPRQIWGDAAGKALGRILPTLEHQPSPRLKASEPSRQHPMAGTPLVAVGSTRTIFDEDVMSRFSPSPGDIAEALLIDNYGQHTRLNRTDLLGASLTLSVYVAAIGLSLWLYG